MLHVLQGVVFGGEEFLLLEFILCMIVIGALLTFLCVGDMDRLLQRFIVIRYPFLAW